MKLLREIIITFLVTITVILIIYTIWFLFMQFFDLPSSYSQLHEGKGAARCIKGGYCMIVFWGVKCCDFIEVIAEYFNLGIYLIKIFLIPITLITLILFIRREKSYPL